MRQKTIPPGLREMGIVAGILAISGCLHVSAPKRVNIHGPSVGRQNPKEAEKSHDGRKIGKDEVYTIARDRAVNAGAPLPEYDIHDKKVRGYYWVFFERRHPRKEQTWKNHFVIRVSTTGRSTLYKPSPRDSGVNVRKMKKDRAYDIAHRIAHREGAHRKGYEIHDKEIDGNYWVVFETKKYKKKAGWKNHFAVRVSRTGQAELYK